MREYEIPDDVKTERALKNYGYLVNSAYAKGEPLDMEQLPGEESYINSYLFDICDYFGLPFTNNIAYDHSTIEIGEFLEAVNKALEMSGWVSPQDHQRALQEVRRSAR